MKRRKLLAKLRRNQKNVKFEDFVNLVEGFGFTQTRTSGSHQIFTNEKVDEILNLQKVNGEIKPYQIKQFLDMIDSNDLKLED